MSDSRVWNLEVTGMSCQNCVRHVTEALQGIPGVADPQVDLDAKRATFTAPSSLDPRVIVAALDDAGYEARVL